MKIQNESITTRTKSTLLEVHKVQNGCTLLLSHSSASLKGLC